MNTSVIKNVTETKKKVSRHCQMLAISAMMMLSNTVNAFAAGGGGNPFNADITVNTGAADHPEDVINGTIGTIIQYAFYLGVIGIIGGLIALGLAVRNEDAEARNKAGGVILGGVVLIAIKSILNGYGIVG